MIGVDAVSAKTGIVTVGAITMDGAVANFMAIASFTVNVDFAMAASSTKIEGPTETVDSMEIVEASMMAVADTVGADNDRIQ